MGKKGVRLALFTDNIIAYVEKSKGIYRKKGKKKTTLRTNKCLAKSQDTRLIIHIFLCNSNNQLESKFLK